MYRVRASLALGFVLAGSSMAAACGSDDNPGKVGTGGSSGAGGAEAGGTAPDAGSGGSGASALCGNAQPDPGEDCDDGNNDNADGCDARCKFTCTNDAVGNAVCQNGVLCDGEETCGDDHQCKAATKPLADGVICGQSHRCKAGVCELADALCGDQLVVSPEECDDGNDDATDGCADCRFTCLTADSARDCSNLDPCGGTGTCNDFSHECERGHKLADYTPCGDGSSACIAGSCTKDYCSNGRMDAGEECDDGNRANGDGCDSNCKFSCLPSDSARDCHSENACLNSGTCNVELHRCSVQAPKPAGTACGTDGKDNCAFGNCLAAICGDGIRAPTEACDDGNRIDGDGCNDGCKVSCTNATADCPTPPACHSAVCTSGVCGVAVDTSKNGQACDIGSGSTTCNAGACGTCGDGIVQAGEQCDDGNNKTKDGCEPDCKQSCQNDANCNDGDECNGTEICAAVSDGGKACKPGTAKTDGVSCGGSNVCVNGSCRPSFCGDGVPTGTEECEPPNTLGCDENCKARALCKLDGAWAVRIVAQVAWGDDQLLAKKTGEIRQWAMLTVAQNGTALTGTVKACGLSIPDFVTTSTFNDEIYGTTFANAGFDATTNAPIPLTGSVTSQLLGATINMAASAVQLGVTIVSPANPFGTWPSVAQMTTVNGYTFTDTDNDGLPGFTALTKSGDVPGMTGITYKNPICDISGGLQNALRANRLQLAIRQIVSQTGTIDSCTTMSGSADLHIENHIFACRLESGAACNQNQIGLLDGARPQYVVSSAKFAAQLLKGTGSCDAVRTTLR
jgi:cysteine-rich repeat protein